MKKTGNRTNSVKNLLKSSIEVKEKCPHCEDGLNYAYSRLEKSRCNECNGTGFISRFKGKKEE